MFFGTWTKNDLIGTTINFPCRINKDIVKKENLNSNLTIENAVQENDKKEKADLIPDTYLVCINSKWEGITQMTTYYLLMYVHKISNGDINRGKNSL